MQDENKRSEEEYKAVRAQYFREWRAKHKDKVSQYNKTYWIKRAEKERLKKQEGENNG